MPRLLVGVCVAVLSAGCDVVFGLDARPPVPPPPPDGGALPCDHGKPFPAGVEVPIVGTYSIEGARFNAQESLAYLSLCPDVTDKASCDLYTGFPTGDGRLGGFSQLGAISTAGIYDSYPSITSDGNYLVFGSERTTPKHVHIWVATAVNGSFDQATLSQPELLAGATYTNEPWMVGDRTLYFGASVVDPPHWDLYRTEGPAPDFGGAAAKVPGVNSADEEFAPVATSDELELFFASNRQTPSVGLALDVYAATRGTTSDPFGTPTRLAALSTASSIDWPLWISPDRCRLYYINKDAAGIARLFVTNR